MKRVFLCLLAAFVLLSLPACSFRKPAADSNLILELPADTTSTEATEDTLAEIPTDTSVPVDTTAPESTIPANNPTDKNYSGAYNDLIQDFAELIVYRFSNDFSGEYVENFPGISSTLRAALSNSSAGLGNAVFDLSMYSDATTLSDYGYILNDLNTDGIPELFWVRKDHSIVAIFTYYEGSIYLLDSYWARYSGYITQDNTLCTYGSSGAADNGCSIYALSNGQLYTTYSFYSTSSGSTVQYYESDGVSVNRITQAQYINLQKQYALSQSQYWMSQPIKSLPEVQKQVKIHRADFPIFDGPSYDHIIVGTVEIATTYTILEEVKDTEGNLWGRLKSGAGWIDLSLLERESRNMPPVTVSWASQKVLSSGNYYYCEADSSSYAYKIAICAHESLRDVSFFFIEAGAYKRGPELYRISTWDSGKPFVASVYFPGAASMYGLEFTDSRGVTRIYSIGESGRNGSVGIAPLSVPLAPADPEPSVPSEPPSIPDSLDMYFSSGAGAWGTVLTLNSNGYFSGEYHDSEMGATGEGYPGGTCYICQFNGSFQITGTSTYAVTLSLNELDTAAYESSQWIEDGICYIVSDAYGIEGGSSFLLYMPSTPVSELPENIRYWGHSIPQTGTLGCYALYCIDTGTAFFGS